MRKKLYLMMMVTLVLGWGFYASKYKTAEKVEVAQFTKHELANKIGTNEVVTLIEKTIELNQEATKEIDQNIVQMEVTMKSIGKKIAEQQANKGQIQSRVVKLQNALQILATDTVNKGKVSQVLAKTKMVQPLVKEKALELATEERSGKAEDIVERINHQMAGTVAFFTQLNENKVFSIAAKHLLASTKDSSKVRFDRSSALVPEVAKIKSTHGVDGIDIEVRDGTPTKDVIALANYVRRQFGIKPQILTVDSGAAEPLMMRIHTKK